MTTIGGGPSVAIIDYGAGNLLSLSRAIAVTGGTPSMTHDPAIAAQAAAIILPGVGAAGSAMERLRATGMDALLRTTTQPMLGICLGMQLFFDHTAEDDCNGLGLIPGYVRRLIPSPGCKVPHMGWNQVTWDAGQGAHVDLLAGVPSGTYMYFVHSYTCEPAAGARVATAWADHGGPVCAAIGRDRLWGTQFHPEKSGDDGLAVLRQFVRAAARSAEGQASRERSDG